MIGDRLEVDVLFGRKAGIATMLVLTGALILALSSPLGIEVRNGLIERRLVNDRIESSR